jgi:hypothetical protein
MNHSECFFSGRSESSFPPGTSPHLNPSDTQNSKKGTGGLNHVIGKESHAYRRRACPAVDSSEGLKMILVCKQAIMIQSF